MLCQLKRNITMRNMNHLVLICVLSFVLIKTSYCLQESDHYPLQYPDECDFLCKPSVLPHTVRFERLICQRGCRFFRIAAYLHRSDMNITREDCYKSCSRSYTGKENGVCKIGCDLRYQNKDLYSSHLFSENADALLLLEPSQDLIEADDDVFEDPSILSQIDSGFDKYKIPETHTKTMPVAKDTANIHSSVVVKAPAGDWLDCASKNSGIPRWILLTAILSAVLIALFLSFSSEKREENNSNAKKGSKVDDWYLVKNEFNPEKESKTAVLDVQFTAPPKYTAVDSEKV